MVIANCLICRRPFDLDASLNGKVNGACAGCTQALIDEAVKACAAPAVKAAIVAYLVKETTTDA